MLTDMREPSSSASATIISEVPEKKSLAKKALQKLSWKGKGKQPSWPEPEKSIGNFITKLSSENYWTVQERSPAFHAYKEICPEIKKHLEDYMSDDTPEICHWWVYMVGDSKDTTSPTIIFFCESKSYRKDALKVIGNSGILDEFPGFILADLKRRPDATGPLLVLTSLLSSAEPGGSGGRYHQDTFVEITLPSTTDSEDTVRKLNIYENFPRIHNFNEKTEQGCKIRSDDGKIAENKGKATIGGPVYIDGVCCFMTAAHAFVNTSSPRYLNVPSSDKEDYDTAVPSESMGHRNIGVVEESLTPAHESTPGESQRESEWSSILQKLPQDARFIGRLFYSSIKNNRAELDYALVMTNSKERVEWGDMKKFKEDKFELPQFTNEAQFEGLDDALVLSRTASARLEGSINLTPAFIRRPGTKKYQLVFSVQFSKPLALGDSGSWVHSKVNGCLHGHITTGSPPDGLALIIPAYQVFDDIRSNLRPGTPSWTNYFECRRKLRPRDGTSAMSENNLQLCDANNTTPLIR